MCSSDLLLIALMLLASFMNLREGQWKRKVERGEFSKKDTDMAEWTTENITEFYKNRNPRLMDSKKFRPSRDALALGAAEFSAAWRRQYAQLFSVYREYYEDLAGAADRAVVAVLTSCGGGYGLKGATTGDALGCTSVGFVKSLAKELPKLGLCLVDVDDGDRALAADRLVQELAAGSDDDEVGYLGDQRHVIGVRIVFRDDDGDLVADVNTEISDAGEQNAIFAAGSLYVVNAVVLDERTDDLLARY